MPVPVERQRRQGNCIQRQSNKHRYAAIQLGEKKQQTIPKIATAVANQQRISNCRSWLNQIAMHQCHDGRGGEPEFDRQANSTQPRAKCDASGWISG